jgi:putative DNA primase/helicase
LQILRDTEANRGLELAPDLLADYFRRRGIDRVPPTAMAALRWSLDPYNRPRLIPDDPAIVFPITDGKETIGAHITWLAGFVAATKRDKELGPQRQFFGPVASGYIKLYAGELDPKSKLVIAEGVETALAAAQIANGLPAIAGLSANNLAKITPPTAAEYIVAADNDAPGLRGARGLAAKLVRAGHVVRLAIPPRPDTDWNDVLMEAISK